MISWMLRIFLAVLLLKTGLTDFINHLEADKAGGKKKNTILFHYYSIYFILYYLLIILSFFYIDIFIVPITFLTSTPA